MTATFDSFHFVVDILHAIVDAGHAVIHADHPIIDTGHSFVDNKHVIRNSPTLLSIVFVTLKYSAAAIRASSCVSLSSLFSASSISFFPIRFFRL